MLDTTPSRLQAVPGVGPQTANQVIAAARQNSWTGRVAAMSELIEQVLSEKQARGDSWDRRLTRLYRVDSVTA